MAQGAADLTPAAMAATLETLMQLQKQLLSFTAATAASQQQPGPGSGGPRREEAPYQLGGGSGSGRDSFGSRPALSQHGLDETDLRESLEQLRRSQQYTVRARSSHAQPSMGGLRVVARAARSLCNDTSWARGRLLVT